MKIKAALFITLFAFLSIGHTQNVYGVIAQKNTTPIDEKSKIPSYEVAYTDPIQWMYPKTFLEGEQYERVELAIDLPDSITTAINRFIATGDTLKGINPFLEWQLDIEATFTHNATGTTFKTDAFYYRNYARDTSAADFRSWRWKTLPTPHFMRVRFAPPLAGEWSCSVRVQTKTARQNYPTFNFNISPTNNPGYVGMGESKRFFTLGNETYFPVGQNLVSPRCEYCFANSGKALPGKKTGPAIYSLESWMLEPTTLKGFLIFQEHMRTLAANGGNYFREILMPQNQDIEWEHLGNYSNRMNRAWEMDEQIFLASELDLKIQLNVQIQFALETDQNRIFWNWSVDPNDKRHATAATPCANPYNREIATTLNDDPNSFFSDPTAKQFYKQKLRYIVSRWGYSTAIAVFGMASEIETCCTDSDVCAAWMEEMGDYLKDDLKINQLLTPSFLGVYHDPENYENKIMASEAYDISTLNWYSVSPGKFQGTSRIIDNFNTTFDQPFFYGEMGNSDLYPCDTARIEWVRDAWMSSFTGNAGTGLNWDDPFDPELRKHLGHINTFVRGIDFDNGGDPWMAHRIISDNRKAETVFLLSPDKAFAVGVISNRYYNWYLTGDTTVARNGRSLCANRAPSDPGFDASLPPAERGIWERPYAESPRNYIDRVSGNTQMNNPVVYTPFESFDYTKNKHYRLRIYDLLNGNYTVDFYNALTLEYLGSQTNWGPNVKLEYPEMNEETGLIAFKLRLNRSDDFPQIAEADRVPVDFAQITASENENEKAFANNRYRLSVLKSTPEIQIELLDTETPRTFSLEVYDSNDQLVLSERFKKNADTFSHQLTPGETYRFEVNINHVVYETEMQMPD